MEFICFVPGCTNILHLNKNVPSYYTFHRLPQNVKYLDQLLAALDLPDTTETDSESVMCSAHFDPIIEHTHLVRYLLEEMIQEKPSVMAVSSAPRCAASVAGCCMNLYSGVALFKFPEAGRSFDLWRMVAGSPPVQDCLFLCARHFKRNSFSDLNMEELIEGSIPVYPTRPLHPVHTNYRPLKKLVRPESPTVSNVIDPYHDDDCTTTKPKCESKKKWRCAAVGCDVSNESHPDMRKINMPPYNDRLSLWREIVGDTPARKYNNSLCTRHFGINQFYDGETRKHFVKMTNPVYPTGPLNLNTMDYCPPELDITVAMDTDGDENLVVVTLDDDGQSETEIVSVEDETDGSPPDVDTMARCSSIGCPVASKTHPNVKIYNVPYKSPSRIHSWLRIAGETCIRPLRLCARHFDIHNRELIPKYPFWDLDPESQTYRPKFDPVNPRCCVPGCSPLDDEDLSYHRFPLDKQAFKVWVQRIGWKQLELYEKGDVFRGFRVCSAHFSRSWFTVNSSEERVLRPGAIPTLFSTGDNLKDKSNEVDMSYDMASMGSQNFEEESYVVSTTADFEESNFRPVNLKKRSSLPQGSQTPIRKKQKLSRQCTEPASAAEDHSDLQTSSNNSEISFWIASPPISGEIEESDPTFVEEEWVLLDSKGVVVDSQLNTECSVGGHLDAMGNVAESNSIQKVEESFPPDTEDVGSDGNRDDSSGDRFVVQDGNIIEESETCELWTKSSHFEKQLHSDVLEHDFLGSASRLCCFDATKVEKLKSLKGKKKKALDELEELLVEHLEHVVSITGIDFLRKCFDHVVNGGSKKNQKKQQGVPEETGKFAVSLQSLSETGYCTLSQITNLPHPSVVRGQWATNDTGYPGFNKHAFTKLSDKVKELGDEVFFVSLCVAEMTIDKHVEKNGSDLFGYVDLGCGRIRDDFISEATSVLMFHANGITHDFSLSLGYCLIHYLPPKIRANLIRQYLHQLHSIGVKCNALICDGSAMTYRTYIELGIFTGKMTPQCGFFRHPANQATLVYCYVDIDDAMMLTKNFLAENEFFLNRHKKKVRWSDVEQLEDFLHWDLSTKESLNFDGTGGAIGELGKLQVQLKNDSRPFKRNGALALKCLYQRYCHTVVKAVGSIEFLTKMESISDLFSGRNTFSKEQPAILRNNTTVALGSIKNHLIYLNSLTDLNDQELVNGSRRIPILYLLLNLLSLEGYLKKTFFYEKKLRAKMVMTQSFTLSNMRQSMKQLVSAAGSPLITASRFKDAYFFLFCGRDASECPPKYVRSNKAPSKEHVTPSTIFPLHIGLRVSESYTYERLSAMYDRFGDFITDNVIHSWLESRGCPDCKSLVMNEINGYDSVKTSLISDVNKMLKIAERYLSCLRDEIPLSTAGKGFCHFANSVLNEMTSFNGFKLHEHLFNSVEFGRTTHFITLIKEVLTIFLRYRISFMQTQSKIIIEPKTRTTFSRRPWT